MKNLLTKLLVFMMLCALVLTSCAVEQENVEKVEDTSSADFDEAAFASLYASEMSTIGVVGSVVEGPLKIDDADLSLDITPSKGDTFSLLTEDTVKKINEEAGSEVLTYNKYKKVSLFVDFDKSSEYEDDKEVVELYYEYVLSDNTKTKIVIINDDDPSIETEEMTYEADKFYVDIMTLVGCFGDNEPDSSMETDAIDISMRETINILLSLGDNAPNIKLTYKMLENEKITADIKLASSKGGTALSLKAEFTENSTLIASAEAALALSLSDDFDVIYHYKKDASGYWQSTTENKGDVSFKIEKLKLTGAIKDNAINIDVSGSFALNLKTGDFKASLSGSQSLNAKKFLSVDLAYEGNINDEEFSFDSLKIYTFEVDGKKYNSKSVKTNLPVFIGKMGEEE